MYTLEQIYKKVENHREQTGIRPCSIILTEDTFHLFLDEIHEDGNNVPYSQVKGTYYIFGCKVYVLNVGGLGIEVSSAI